jgi:hypothetical protein
MNYADASRHHAVFTRASMRDELMLIGLRLQNERLLQQHVVYDLELDGRRAGRFTWRPITPWKDVVFDGRTLAFGCEAQSIREMLSHILSGGSAKPFVIRDAGGTLYAQAQLTTSHMCSFNVGGRTFCARKRGIFRHALSIVDDRDTEVGTVRFRKVEGVRQIVVDVPSAFGAPLQILLIGILHVLIERNQSD